VADYGNATVRKITPAGVVTTIAGLPGTTGNADGAGSAARFLAPIAVAVDAAGEVYVLDNGSSTIRVVTSTGVVTTAAGSPGITGSSDGLGSNARFNQPYGIAIDSTGNLYIGDLNNNTIRRASALGSPQLVTQPQSQTANAGGSVTLSAAAAGSNLSYQWQLNGANVPGATNPILAFPNVGANQAGNYDVVITNPSGTVTTGVAAVAVNVNAHMINLSTQAFVGTGATFTAGFAIGGAGSKSILVRASGPALGVFGIAGFLPQPQLVLHSSSSIIASNAVWGGTTALVNAFAQVFAFPWALTSADSALLVTLPANNAYTAAINGVNNTSGTMLAELYDADTGTPTAYLTNISSNGVIGPGGLLTAGFVINGTTSETILIRADGPGLTSLGVQGAITQPQLTLFDSTGKTLATNTVWGGGADLVNVFKQVFAFPLPLNSADSALVVTLAPGPYTAQVSGVNGSTGIVLVEVYDVP